MKFALNRLRPQVVLNVLRAMPTIGFSYYGEDKIVFQLKPSNKGFYADVGAYHPVEGSNTYKLYLKGWDGITIEPNPANANAFRKMRPRDRHVIAGIAPESGVREYHQFAAACMNTLDAGTAETAVRTDAAVPTGTLTVDVQPLSKVLDEMAPQRHVDFLNVDCEGMDLEVLKTLDLPRQKPTVICIEDHEQFKLGHSSFSGIGSFLHHQGYSVIGQTLYSFVYVDTNSFGKPKPTSGFEISESVVEWVRRLEN